MDLTDAILDAAGKETVAVAFSGGLDSTVLLHVAAEAIPASRLVAIHVDHGLRADADADARWSRETASSLGIRCAVVAIDLPSSNRQANARTARYAAIGRQMQAYGATRLFTAHHADDAVESALERLSRGSGLSAMTGLRARAEILGIDVRRPFLEFGKEVLTEWAQEHEIEWREDATNRSSTYVRNAIRNDVLPVLTEQRGLAPMRRSIANLRAEAAVVEGAVQNLVDAATLEAPGRRTISLDRRWLSAADETMRRLTILRAIEPIDIFLEQVHLDAIDELSDPEGVSWLDVPNGRVAVTATRLTFAAQPVSPQRTTDVVVRLEDEPKGALPWFDHVVMWGAFDDGLRLKVPSDAELVVSGPRPGARLEVETGSRKVTDILRDAGVSPEDRWRWPCVHLGETCLAVAGLRATTIEHGELALSIRCGERTRSGETRR